MDLMHDFNGDSEHTGNQDVELEVCVFPYQKTNIDTEENDLSF